MRTFIITPYKGLMQAPGIAITIKDSKTAYYDAIQEAKLLSRLSDFEGWNFA